MRPSSQKLLSTADAPFFLVTDPFNVRYLTGAPLDDGYVLVTAKRYLLFVGDLSRYTADTTVYADIAVRSTKDLPKFLEKAHTCGFEVDRVTVEEKAGWKKRFPKTKFVACRDPLKQFRRQKTRMELRHIRAARSITDEILRRVPSMLRKKITEEKLARQLQIWALELGADGMAFPPIVAFGNHSSCPHHVPTSRLLKKGHIVQIDVGAKVKGYCADASEVFFTARPTRLQKRVYETLVEAQSAALKILKRGVTTHRLDQASREVLKREELDSYFPHSLGHGVGLEIHEGVSISSRGPEVQLLKHEVVTIEPGVYFEGKFGMRVECMVIID